MHVINRREVTSVPFVADLASHGDRTAIIAGEQVVTYAELAASVRAQAEAYGPVRRLVLVAGSNDLETLVAYLGALAGSHPVMLVHPGSHHMSPLVETYRPDVVAAGHGSHRGLVELHPTTSHDLHPDLALVSSTSGSTGSPKTVRLSHRNLQSNAEAIAEYLEISRNDRAITTLPLHYCYGLSVVHSHLLRGAAIVLSDRSVVDRCFWRDVRRHGVTSFAGVPHTFDLLDRAGFDEIDAPSLRTVTQAGGRLAPDAVQRFARLGAAKGWRLFVMYGQTEATARMAYLPPELAIERPTAIGVPVPGGSFRLLRADGADDVHEGELVYSGPNVMMGYATCPADLADGASLRELRTGDLARRADDGLYEIVGRASRFAKIFGHRIDLDRVEDLVAVELGTAALCADGGEVLAVAVRGADPVRTRDVVARRLSLPHTCVEVVAVDELPLLPSGKPDRSAVVPLARDATDAVVPASATGIRPLLARVLGLSDIADGDTFVSLGGDSLSYVEVSVGLEQAIGRLPQDWHVTPIEQLEQLAPRRSFLRRVETDVALRAVAILLVVGSHASLFRVRGGAHVLLAVAGYNFARFQMGAGAREAGGPWRPLRTAGRVVLPAAVWLGALTVLTDDYGWQSITMVNAYLGPRHWDPAWRFWFIEALALSLLAATVLLAVPAVRRAERAHPMAVGFGLLGLALVLRFDVTPLAESPEPLLVPHRVAFFFLIGWLAQRAGALRWRALLTVAVLASVPGFFDEPARDAVVVAGLLLLLWVPTVAVPRPLNRVIGVVAAASLAIYLTHWQVFQPLLDRGASPLVAVGAALLVGIAGWWLVESARRRSPWSARRGRRSGWVEWHVAQRDYRGVPTG